MNKCEYCDNTGRRTIGKRRNGARETAPCEVCDTRARKQQRAFERMLRNAERLRTEGER